MRGGVHARHPSPRRKARRGYRSIVLLLNLVHFDDVAFGVVKENLLPTAHRPGAVVRIGNALVLQALLKGLDIVGAEGYMAALHRVYCLAGAKIDAQILLCQVKLGRAVGTEGNPAGIAVLIEYTPRLK